MAVNLAPTEPRKSTAQDTAGLVEVFEQLHPESCPRHFNFHMHTVCSDGRLQPQELIEQAIAIGLRGLAITDHHTVDGFYAAHRYLRAEYQRSPNRPLPQLWVGVEITAQLLDTEVHILGYGFNPDHGSIRSYLWGQSPKGPAAAAARVIAAIQAAGGLAVLAHPVRYRRSPEDLIPAAVDLGIDGVEAFYAYDNPAPWRPSQRQTERVRALSRNFNLLHTCGTDTHGRSLLQRL